MDDIDGVDTDYSLYKIRRTAMNDTKELLSEIFKSAELSMTIMRMLIQRCKGKEFRTRLAKQYAGYHGIMIKAARCLRARGEKPVSCGKGGKLPICCSVSMSTMIDSTSSHIYEMLIQGNAMAMIDLLRDLRDYPAADRESSELAKTLIRMEESFLRRSAAALMKLV